MITLLKESLAPLYRYIGSRNRREFYKLLDRYGKVERFQPRTIAFINYRFDVPDCASFIWQFKDIFVDEIYKFKSSSIEPVILDCGANIGTSCLYFKNLYPNARIRAFEADPNIADILKANLRENGIVDIEVVDKAVWVNNDGVEFGMQGADGSSIYSDTNKTRVGSVRLKDELERAKEVDFLKMDIEGAEAEVLIDCGGYLSRVKHLFVEYHSLRGQAQRLSEISGILTENGFRYYMESIPGREHPFIDEGVNPRIDLQLNIYAYRLDDD
jgi:FkbM family methyltransferase